MKLGLIPGAGGTQRLPRLCGMAKALEMCAWGEAVGAEEALRLGIVDRLAEGDLLEAAIEYARGLPGIRKCREFHCEAAEAAGYSPRFVYMDGEDRCKRWRAGAWT